MWCPFSIAERLRIPVVELAGLADPGRWYPDRRIIALRRGMVLMQRRSVLAHELGHAVLGHCESTPRTEAQADRWAAMKLIDRDAFIACARGCPEHPEQWCIELQVTPRMLRTWLRTQPGTQAAAAMLPAAA